MRDQRQKRMQNEKNLISFNQALNKHQAETWSITILAIPQFSRDRLDYFLMVLEFTLVWFIQTAKTWLTVTILKPLLSLVTECVISPNIPSAFIIVGRYFCM